MKRCGCRFKSDHIFSLLCYGSKMKLLKKENCHDVGTDSSAHHIDSLRCELRLDGLSVLYSHKYRGDNIFRKFHKTLKSIDLKGKRESCLT